MFPSMRYNVCVCVSADIVTGIGRMRIANAMRFDTTQSFIEYPLSVRTSHQRQSPLAATKSPFCPSRFFWFVMVFGALDALHFIPLRFWLCSFDHFAIVIQYCALVPCFARPSQIRHEARRANKCPAQTCIWCTFACWPPMDTRNPLNIWLGIFHYAQQLLQSVAVISANTWISTDFIHSYFFVFLFVHVISTCVLVRWPYALSFRYVSFLFCSVFCCCFRLRNALDCNVRQIDTNRRQSVSQLSIIVLRSRGNRRSNSFSDDTK